MFHEKTAGSVTFFSFAEFEEFSGFVHAVTTRDNDRARSRPQGQDAEPPRQVADSRAEVLRELQVKEGDLRFLRQVHSARIVECSAVAADARPQGDGILIVESGVFGVIQTADCVPLILVAPRQQACCLLHAGWRGTRDHIARAGIEALEAASGAAPESIQAAFGPCIRACCYEVGPDFPEMFGGAGHRLDGIFSGRNLDLVAANRADLEAAGVRQILDCGICTACHSERFYSYRARKDRGRLWTLAGFRG